MRPKREEYHRTREYMLEVMPASWRKMYQRAWAGSRPVAVRCLCGECMGWDRDAVKSCTADACPLWAVRQGAKKGGAK